MVLFILLSLGAVGGVLYQLSPSDHAFSVRRKPGRRWFYAGVFTFFAVAVVLLVDLGFAQVSFPLKVNTKVLSLVGVSEGALLLIGSAIAHFEHTVSGSSLLSHAGLSNRLLRYFPLGPVRASFTYLMLCSLPLCGWSAWHGRLLQQVVGSRLRYGLVNFSSGVVGYLLVVPMILGLTLHLFDSFERGIYQNEHLISPVLKLKSARWLRKERTGLPTLVIIFFLTGIAVLGYRVMMITDKNWDWIESATGKVEFPYLFGFEIACAWIGFFLVGCSIAHGLVVLRFIRDLGRFDLPLQLFSSDRRWGLAGIGRCAVVVSVITGAAVTVPVLLYYDTIRLRQGGITVRICLASLLLSVFGYAAMLAFSLVVAVWPLHLQMVKAKEKVLAECNDLLSFSDRATKNSNTWKDHQRALYRKNEVARCKTWPYGRPGILRNLAALALPLLGALGEHRLGSALQAIFARVGR